MAAEPAACFALCDADAGCTHFSHRNVPTPKNCILYASCSSGTVTVEDHAGNPYTTFIMDASGISRATDTLATFTARSKLACANACKLQHARAATHQQGSSSCYAYEYHSRQVGSSLLMWISPLSLYMTPPPPHNTTTG